MKIRLRLFAGLKQRVGAEWLDVDLPDGATAADVRGWLAQRYPEVEPIVRRALLACHLDYVPDSFPLVDNQEVACIPPVSGG